VSLLGALTPLGKVAHAAQLRKLAQNSQYQQGLKHYQSPKGEIARREREGHDIPSSEAISETG
jgi:hypothetical protein